MVNRSYNWGPDKALDLLHGFEPSTFELTRFSTVLLFSMLHWNRVFSQSCKRFVVKADVNPFAMTYSTVVNPFAMTYSTIVYGKTKVQDLLSQSVSYWT